MPLKVNMVNNLQIHRTGRNFCTLLWYLKAFCHNCGSLFFKVLRSLLNISCSFTMLMGSQTTFNPPPPPKICLGSVMFKKHYSVTKPTWGRSKTSLWRISSPCCEQYIRFVAVNLILQSTWETLSGKQEYCLLKAHVFLIFFSSLKTTTYSIYFAAERLWYHELKDYHFSCITGKKKIGTCEQK